MKAMDVICEAGIYPVDPGGNACTDNVAQAIIERL